MTLWTYTCLVHGCGYTVFRRPWLVMHAMRLAHRARHRVAARLSGVVSLPTPIERPEAYNVTGERWCSYVPPEPMTDTQAVSAHEARERAVNDERWRQTVDGARNRRACAVRGVDVMCTTHGRSIVVCRVLG